jgi:hypothetical protein
MRQQHDRFGHRLFDRRQVPDQDGTYMIREPKSYTNTNTQHTAVIDCGRDTGDECTNNKPQPRKHGDECTNTHKLISKL